MNICAQKQQGIRHQFDAFCKKVVKHEMINHYREVDRRRKREILFSEMSSAQLGTLRVMDEYIPDECVFYILGYRIIIKNMTLAESMAALPKERRKIILLYYYVGMNDREIGLITHRQRQTICYNRQQALKLIRKFMEDENNVS